MRSTTSNYEVLRRPRCEVVFLFERVAPGLEDLTDRRTDLDDLVGEYPTRRVGRGTHDYHLGIRVPARDIGERMLAGRAVLMVDGQAAAEGDVLRRMDR